MMAMIMMAKPMKAQTESADPVLNNTNYISKLKKIETNPNIILI